MIAIISMAASRSDSIAFPIFALFCAILNVELRLRHVFEKASCRVWDLLRDSDQIIDGIIVPSLRHRQELQPLLIYAIASPATSWC